MQTNSNAFTLIFAAGMTILVATLLSGLANGLKPMQDANLKLDKQFNIVKSVENDIVKDNAEATYLKKITELVIDGNGKKQTDVSAFDIDLRKELAKDDKSAQRFPLYLYKDGTNNKVIVPLHGNGLWDYIGGFLALETDYNTVSGAIFTHVGETPGLGAEISKDWFQDNFKGEKLMKGNEFVGIDVLKGKGNVGQATTPHQVDGISGATITGDGVEMMINNVITSYLPYFSKKGKGGLSMN